MFAIRPNLRTPRRAGLGIALALAAGVAVAQPTEVVVVEAARTVSSPSPSSPVKTREVSLQGWVRYSDLDLTTESGASELERRIEQSARSLCKEIDAAYPLIKGDDCVRNAVDEAMVAARKAIADKRAAAGSP